MVDNTGMSAVYPREPPATPRCSEPVITRTARRLCQGCDLSFLVGVP
jgi:hypothetical protein